MPRGHLHLNMATVSLSMGKRLAVLHGAAGADYVSAPVFGRPWVAAQGQLDIVIGGPAVARARCEPVFAALAKTQFVAGEEPFKANIVKIARNYLLASVVESFGEALALVRKSGVDPVAFYELMTTTSFSGPSYRNYGKLMVERKFDGAAAFTLRLGLKDVELALAAGGETRGAAAAGGDYARAASRRAQRRFRRQGLGVAGGLHRRARGPQVTTAQKCRDENRLSGARRLCDQGRLDHPRADASVGARQPQCRASPRRSSSRARAPRCIAISGAEEIYHITAGEGLMTLGEQRFAVAAGDTICIAPGTPHCIANTGAGPLKILCACSPAYAHDDTELL